MKIHSLIDVITNSSAEVYSYLNDDAAQKAQDFISRIVRAVKPDINIEDYFEFRIGINQEYIDDNLIGGQDYLDFKNSILSSYPDLTEYEIEEKFSDYVQENYEDYVDDDYFGDNQICYIKVKNTNQKIEISSLIHEIFDLQAIYD